MGVELGFTRFGVRPSAVWIERFDGAEQKGPYAAIVHLLFATEAERMRFREFRTDAEAIGMLHADYQNYTDMPPDVRVSRWVLAEKT